MRKYLIFVILIVLSSCSQSSYSGRFKISEKEKLVNKVEKNVVSNLQRQYGLIPFGSGGQMMYEIKKLRLIFKYPKPLTEEEAIELVIRAVDEYVFSINKEVALRQYLANYPFGPKNVEMTIYLQDSRGTSVQPEKFLLVEASDGFVTCEAKNPDMGGYRIVFKESFEEAKRKVTGQL